MIQFDFVTPFVELRDFGRWVGLILTRRAEDGDDQIASVSWKKRDFGIPEDCMVRISTMDAQALMDMLWRCGLRPAESVATEATMRAVQNHIDDLRKIVFKNGAHE